ncbi:MAG: transporter substrate-binding domain-containing protein [Pseudomonadota bacterium]
MKRTVLTWLMLISLLLCMSGAAQAGEVMKGVLERGELRVGTSPDNPPLSLRSRDDKLMGYDIDLAAMVAGGLGVKLSLVPLPFSELLPALEQGKVDLVISGMTMLPQRNAHFMFVGPYLVSGQAILARNETVQRLPEPSELNDPEVVIAVAKDTTSLSAVQNLLPQARVLVMDSQELALKAVLEGKAHVLVADHSFCVVAALRYGEQGLSILDKPFTFEPLGIALTDDALLANWLDNFLMMLRGTGRLEMLGQRWFKDAGWMKEMQTDRLL